MSVLFNGIDATNFSGTGSLTEEKFRAVARRRFRKSNLLSSLYDASLGRSGGGNVQVVTLQRRKSFLTVRLTHIFKTRLLTQMIFSINRDGIDRQIARRFEGGGTFGRCRSSKTDSFFFGGYQRTDATTAYVPSAQSFVVVPEALAYLSPTVQIPKMCVRRFCISVNMGGVGNVFARVRPASQTSNVGKHERRI